MKWIGIAEGLLENPNAQFKALNELNEELITKSVVLGNGLKPSAADVIVFSAVHSSVVCDFELIGRHIDCAYFDNVRFA